MERTKRHLRGERYLRTVADDIGDDHMMSSLIERRLENELLAAKRGDVIYDMFHGDINISDTNGFVIQQNVGKRTMPRAKLGDINAFNPESRKESIRTTLRLMGVQGQSQRTVITKQASVTELDDNNSTLTRESNSPNTSEKLKPDSATPPLSRKYLTKHARKRKGMMGAKFKRLAKFLTILFGLWKKHAKRVQRFLEFNVDFLDVERPSDLMFDVTEFKTAKQASVPNDVKRILSKLPMDRTPDEVKRVQVALGNYQPIAEYPLVMTLLMAQKAWYERYTPKRVIIKQGHPPRCYYFILSGSVVMTKMDDDYSISKTECFLGRGEAFGDLAIVNKAPRESTIISRDNVELLVFGDEGSCSVLKKLRNTKHSMYKPVKTKVKLQGQSHRDILSKKLTEADDEREKKSFIFRQKVLQELALGIELIPVGTKKWDPIEEKATITVEQRTKNIKLTTTGPFMTKTNINFNPLVTVVSDSSSNLDLTEDRKQSGQAVIPEIYIEDVPRDERVNPDIYIPQRQSGLNRKTIADGLNERYLSMGHLLTEADRDPLFIRVGTLTKGSTFVRNPCTSFCQALISFNNPIQSRIVIVCRKKLVKMVKKEKQTERTNIHDARSVPQSN
ncbi:hypothetical protein LSH36_81g04047 [Paralvinella palmiformis]|uniref:Cyclic nucleotide-binding domain-containing protein n=1 Tax=Paralvinella palmiformis TaxID=53620 RepID=A0AAD9K3F5_9ANNE|nr:hypothetical protein LSH36_81g04047 [Paralvinella palmiformis]